MGIIIKPFTFTNGTVADANEVNSDLDTLYTLANGNIDSNNLAPNAVATSNIQDGAVTAVKIAFGLGAGQVSAANIPITDAGNFYPTDNVEAALQGIAQGTTDTSWQIARGSSNPLTLTLASFTAPRTWTFQDASDTVVGLATIDTLTNKTLVSPSISDFSNAQHNHQNAAGGGALNVAAITSGILPVVRGGTGVATSTGTGSVVLNTNPTLNGAALSGTFTGTPTFSNVVTFNSGVGFNGAAVMNSFLTINGSVVGNVTGTGNVVLASGAAIGSPTLFGTVALSGTPNFTGAATWAALQTFNGNVDFNANVNFAGTSITGDIVPSVADTYDLGNGVFRFREIFLEVSVSSNSNGITANSGVKGWVKYNQATNTILASYNVSSVTPGGAGFSTINWSTHFNFLKDNVIVCSTDEFAILGVSSQSATAVTVRRMDSKTQIDSNGIIYVAAFGEQ